MIESDARHKVLVLGANGFIGSYVVDALSNKGFYIRAFGHYGSDNSIKFHLSKNIELFQGDFLNQTDIKVALTGVDTVIHLISTTTPATAESDPLIDIDTNIAGSVKLFQQVVSSGHIKQIIYMSSGGTIYGDNYDKVPKKETANTWPVSPYGIGKLAIENYLHYFNKKYNQNYVVFRLANPYGTRQNLMRKQGVIPIFMDKILRNEDILVLGDGSAVRDYVFVNDVAKIVANVIGKNLKHSVYNIGSGRGHSVNEIIKEIEEAVHKKAIIKHTSAPSTFVGYSVLDTHRLSYELPDIQYTTLRDGICELSEEYRKSGLYDL